TGNANGCERGFTVDDEIELLPAIVPRELTPSAEEEPATWSPARVRPSVALQMKTLNNLVAGCKSRREATKFIRQVYSKYPAQIVREELQVHTYKAHNSSISCVVLKIPASGTSYVSLAQASRRSPARLTLDPEKIIHPHHSPTSFKSRINLSATGKACCDEKTNANAAISKRFEIFAADFVINTAVRYAKNLNCEHIRTKVSQEQAAMRAGKKGGRGAKARRRPWKATRNNIAMNTRVSAITRNCDL
ncbi:hypothetical protein ALC62_09485, partial [Cyphomyrmex costatus]